jgi:hypothetical protein
MKCECGHAKLMDAPILMQLMVALSTFGQQTHASHGSK